MHACIHAYLYTKDRKVDVSVAIPTHIHIHTWIHTYKYTYMYTTGQESWRSCGNPYTYSYTCMHTHIHTCIHTNIHTYALQDKKVDVSVAIPTFEPASGHVFDVSYTHNIYLVSMCWLYVCSCVYNTTSAFIHIYIQTHPKLRGRFPAKEQPLALQARWCAAPRAIHTHTHTHTHARTHTCTRTHARRARAHTHTHTIRNPLPEIHS
jgi:hypothetical protein